LLEIIDPSPDTGRFEECFFDTVRVVTLEQESRVSVGDEPTVMDEKQMVAYALGEGQVLGREQNGGTTAPDMFHEAS
jgi:hypothetical protein